MINSGVHPDTAALILDEALPSIRSHISTKKLYHLIRRLIRKHGKHLATRYGLKAGIMELGPDGFYFEKFIAAIWADRGYEVATGRILQGTCVSHEVDVVGEKHGQSIGVECKFYNIPGKTCDIKTTLYVSARAKDLPQIQRFWLTTNTRFSTDSIQYATCANLSLMSWDYPASNAIKDIVSKNKLYPITCLSSLTKQTKKVLLGKNYILCKDLSKDLSVLQSLKISEVSKENIRQELHKLLEDSQQIR